MRDPGYLLHSMAMQQRDLQSVGRETRQRVWGFARPHRRLIFGFLTCVVAGSLLGVVPPLLFREIIDDAIPSGDRGHLTALGLLVVGAALAASSAKAVAAPHHS